MLLKDDSTDPNDPNDPKEAEHPELALHLPRTQAVTNWFWFTRNLNRE